MHLIRPSDFMSRLSRPNDALMSISLYLFTTRQSG